MIETLRDTLSTVNNWVKFAETKNGANVAFCSAFLFLLLRFLVIENNINDNLSLYIYYITFCLTISLAISLLSFIPQLKMPWLIIGTPNDDDNLLYFGHACKYREDDYLMKLFGDIKYDSKKHRLETEYSNQIISNSKIAFYKFKQFDAALWFTLGALLSPIGILVVLAFRSDNNI